MPAMDARTSLDLETPRGTARAHLLRAHRPAGALVLGHGAGGSVDAPDLQAAVAGARDAGWSAALVEQPYRVAGRRSAPPAEHLDAAWIAVVDHLAGTELRDLPLVTGGRSSGARVACRTAGRTRAVGVVCLAFPLHPPGRPDRTRLPELEAVDVPVLVVQGERDPFGVPPPGRLRRVVVVPGDHGLRAGLDAVRREVGDRLAASSPRGRGTSTASS